MLSAILSGKRRGSGLEGGGAAQVAYDLSHAEGAEDLLTSAVFERLAYLPAEQLNAVFAQLLGRTVQWGELKEIQYWPRWKLGDSQVEPDVLLIFAERTVLVETKRWDGCGQQDSAQLSRELRAGWSDQDVHLPLDCLLLAVGGHADDSTAAQAEMADRLRKDLALSEDEYVVEAMVLNQYEYFGCSWRRLFEALKAALEDSTCRGQLQLLSDIEGVLLWHNLRTHGMSWMAGLMPQFVVPSTRPPELPSGGWQIKVPLAPARFWLHGLAPLALTIRSEFRFL